MATPVERYLERPEGGPSKVDIYTARHALYLMGDEENGLRPGDFTTGLWRLMCHADMMNLARLVAAFPALGEAFEAGMRSLWGFEWMRNAVLDAQASHV